MINIFDQSMFDIAPIILKRSAEFNIFMKAVDSAYQKFLIDKFEELVLTDRLEELEEWKLDLLAEESHVDFYPPNSTKEEKVILVKESIETHIHKGTVGAMKDVLNVFYQNSKLIQWFEEEPLGEHGTFKVKVEGANVDTDVLDDLTNAVDTVKRESQHMKSIIFKSDIEGSLIKKSHSRSHKKTTILPIEYSLEFKNTKLNIIKGTRSRKFMKIGG